MKYEKTLNLIYSNDLIMEELKALFTEEVEEHKPKVHGQSDDVLGQEYRAYEKAREILDDAFVKIRNLQRNESKGSGIHYK